jgi:hypothetical protein
MTEKKSEKPQHHYTGKLRRVTAEELERIRKYSQNAVQISIRPRRKKEAK